jgi:hypothetical protein
MFHICILHFQQLANWDIQYFGAFNSNMSNRLGFFNSNMSFFWHDIVNYCIIEMQHVMVIRLYTLYVIGTSLTDRGFKSDYFE